MTSRSTPPRLPSRYALLEAIGQGGEARVYRIHDRLRNSDLALKLVSPQQAPWLRREFETLRQIHHENLVRVFDWGVSETGAYYTMELVVGSDWSRHTSSQQSPHFVRGVLTGVLRGLAHLHSHGEMHGDLKPANVLLARDRSAKLSDTGMGAAGLNGLSGTPGYAAPELWQGAVPDVRSDIYSVGVMAYEALAGRHPFQGKTVREVVSGQLEGWVPSLAVHGIPLEAEFEQIVMRAMERDPSLRPSSADEFMEGLKIPDRTSGILRGRFVARQSELRQFAGLLESGRADLPTLLWIQGEEGVGKSALSDEFATHAVDYGVRVARASELSEIHVFKNPLHPTFAESEALWTAAAASASAYLIDMQGAAPQAIEAIRVLARHLHVIAIERGRRCGMLLVAERHEGAPLAGAFEEAYALEPFTEVEVGAFVQGYLGTVSLQPEVIEWLTSETGGVAAQLTTVLDELIRQQFLRRHNGQWSLAEHKALPSIGGDLGRSGKWEKSWARLSSEEKAVMILLAVLPNGLALESLTRAVGDAVDIDDLALRGWLRNVGGRLVPGSGEIRRTALEASSSGLSRSLEIALLDQEGTLTREQRAELLLRNTCSMEALQEGLWATREAQSRGDLRVAVERAKVCAKLGERIGAKAQTNEAELLAGEILLLLGEHDDAKAWVESNAPRNAPAELLLGLIERSRGNLEGAISHLSAAIELAQGEGNSGVYLQSNAELAEIEWRHGAQTSRDAALDRLARALSSDVGGRGAANDRAALTYQVGAAMVATGRREEAREVLQRALSEGPSDYWRMRVANALAAAEYYLGKFEVALTWMDEAWRMAERGGFDSFKARLFSSRAGIHYGMGRFRESVEYHRLASVWAERSGEQFEYLASRSGEAASQMLLGDYEQALLCARQACKIAREIGNEYEALKNLETEAASLILVGDYDEVKRLAKQLMHECEKFGESTVAPRALLLAGMLARIDGEWGKARALLLQAERSLLESRDWEDLPVVQIELQAILAHENANDALSGVSRITRDGERDGALIVQLRGCVILGEILIASGIDHRQLWDDLVSGLGKASEAGALEMEWRLNHILAELLISEGERKAAAVRLAQALRVFRVVAGRLSPEHRSCYMRTPHAERLLSLATPRG